MGGIVGVYGCVVCICFSPGKQIYLSIELEITYGKCGIRQFPPRDVDLHRRCASRAVLTLGRDASCPQPCDPDSAFQGRVYP